MTRQEGKLQAVVQIPLKKNAVKLVMVSIEQNCMVDSARGSEAIGLESGCSNGTVNVTVLHCSFLRWFCKYQEDDFLLVY